MKEVVAVHENDDLTINGEGENSYAWVNYTFELIDWITECITPLGDFIHELWDAHQPGSP